MDVSRRDRDRVYHVGPRGSIRVTKFKTEDDEDCSPIARPYAQMDRPRSFMKGQSYYNSPNSSSGSRRSRGEHPYLMRSPARDDDPCSPSLHEQRYSMQSPAHDEEPSAPPCNIPPLLPSEDDRGSGPRPLFSDDVIQKLRESLRRTAARHEEMSQIEWDGGDYDENTYSPPAEPERMTYEEYLEEEENTKRTIDEIIMVAQALRNKIEREEKMRRAYAEGAGSRQPMLGAAAAAAGAVAPPVRSSPSKIPCLLDLHVEPPEEILVAANRYEPDYQPEYHSDYQQIDICWNCDRRGHRFLNCKYQKLKNFCYRCGKRGYDLASCPICNV